MIRITIWNEFRHEKTDDAVKHLYPDGIHMAIRSFLEEETDFAVETATLDEPEHGLTDKVLGKTDVLIWWGHMAHQEVKDTVVEKVYNRVLHGMGLIVLHSGHKSKIFMKLMGTTCNLRSREDERENSRIWTIEPSHPIARGIGPWIELEHEEMYGERFDIPTPESLIFVSWFKGGEVFRSGCTWRRGGGKIFYFQPGHETFPGFYNKEIQTVIKNAVRWAVSDPYYINNDCPYITDPIEVL